MVVCPKAESLGPVGGLTLCAAEPRDNVVFGLDELATAGVGAVLGGAQVCGDLVVDVEAQRDPPGRVGGQQLAPVHVTMTAGSRTLGSAG